MSERSKTFSFKLGSIYVFWKDICLGLLKTQNLNFLNEFLVVKEGVNGPLVIDD